MIRVNPEGFIDYTAPDGWACSYPPGADLTDAPQEVVDAAAVAWTKDVLKAYKAANKPPRKKRTAKKAGLKPRR